MRLRIAAGRRRIGCVNFLALGCDFLGGEMRPTPKTKAAASVLTAAAQIKFLVKPRLGIGDSDLWS